MGRLAENRKKKEVRKKYAACILVAVTLIAFFWMNYNSNSKNTVPGDIVSDGCTYTYNQNLTNILFLGVDYGTGYTDKSIGGHQADTLLIMSIDNTTNKAKFINIPRDLITRLKVYDIQGKFAHITVDPICLAHSYGSCEKDGSNLTMDAVSYLLYGVPIQNYVSMNIDGISKANDLVGGVPVEITEDFTMVDPSMQKGALHTLNGVEAMNYVRQRSLPGMSGSNLDRMKRQVQYMQSFMNRLKQQTQNDRFFLVKLFVQMNNYISTDSIFKFACVLKILMDQGVAGVEIKTVEGAMSGDSFLADDEALRNLVLEVFYIKN